MTERVKLKDYDGFSPEERRRPLPQVLVSYLHLALLHTESDISIVMIILFLRYYSYKTSQKEAKKAKEAAAKTTAETEVKDTGVQTEASIAEQVAPETLG